MKADNGRLWGTLNDGKIEIRSLTQAYLEESLDILDDSFFLNESVCNACEINLPENGQSRAELRELCRLSAEDGVSLVALETATGKAVAVAFNKIQYIPEGNEDPFFLKFRKQKTHSPQAQRLMDFMIEIDGLVDVFEIYKIDCLNEFMFLATLPAFERQGIARTLAKYTIDLTRKYERGDAETLAEVHSSLREKRPRAVTAIFTSQFSQKVGRAMGFQVLNTVPYTDYSYNGKSFDQKINPMHKVAEHVIYPL